MKLTLMYSIVHNIYEEYYLSIDSINNVGNNNSGNNKIIIAVIIIIVVIIKDFLNNRIQTKSSIFVQDFSWVI